MNLEQKLDLILGNFSHLNARIRNLTYDTTSCGDRIEVRCSYPTFRAGEPTVNDFVDVISHHIVPFCLPRSEIQSAQEALATGDHVQAGIAMATLVQKATNLFMKAQKGSSRSGEAGEIVLYILNEWVLRAPQIVSKMYLKTNSNMPVHGTDGIHARFDATTNKLFLYWGESKAHKTLYSALSSALESINEFVQGGQEQREIEIISDHPDFGTIDDATQKAFLDYLDPYSEKSANRIPIFSCLLIHDFETPTGQYTDEELEGIYVQKIKNQVDKFIGDIYEKTKQKGLEMKRFEFFLFPVPSVERFRDRFQSKIGWSA